MKALRLLLVVCAFLAPLAFPHLNSHADPLRLTENLRGETVILPETAPEKKQFLFLSSIKLFADSQHIGSIAFFDDPRTEMRVDYVEVFESTGGLLGVAWFDKFRVFRSAIDYGLFQENPSQLVGVLVPLLEGNTT